jgi:hypothetical protein
MLDGGDGHDPMLLVDLIQHPVAATAGRPGALKRREEEPLARPVRVFQEDGRGDWREMKAEPGVSCWGRSAPDPSGSHSPHIVTAAVWVAAGRADGPYQERVLSFDPF